MVTPEDYVYEIRTHLLYELKWLIYAASQYEGQGAREFDVALIDSAAVHARNLLEFAEEDKDARHFTLASLGGTPGRLEDWALWVNNRVMHMMLREHAKPSWPDGLTNDDPHRLMAMAGAVLKRLTEGGESIPAGLVRDAYDEVLGAAVRYHAAPDEGSEGTHERLARLHDGSRPNEPY